jgi:hypothetical protein
LNFAQLLCSVVLGTIYDGVVMARKPKLRKGEPTQTTDKGLEIPVPKRRDVMGNLKRLAKPSDPKGSPSQQ